MGKRILALPRCTSNTAVGIVLGWPSVHARILVRKLCFLKRLVLGARDGSKLCSRMLRSLADDTETVSLVRECRSWRRHLERHSQTESWRPGRERVLILGRLRRRSWEETKLRGWIGIHNGSGRGLRLGGGTTICVRRVWGYAPPGKYLQIRYSEIASEATFAPKWHLQLSFLSSCTSTTLICIDVQCHAVAVAEESKLPSFHC